MGNLIRKQKTNPPKKVKVLNRYLVILFYLFASPICAQQYWSILSETEIQLNLNSSATLPTPNLKIATLEASSLRQGLENIDGKINQKEDLLFYFPNEQNTLEPFALKEVQIFDSKNEVKYPSIKAYKGASNQREGVSLRITVSPLGISGTMRTPSGFLYFQPRNKRGNQYLFYQRDNSLDSQEKPIFCSTKNEEKNFSIKDPLTTQPLNVNRQSTVIKTYRIAIAATAEYTEFWGDDDASNGNNSSDAFAAVVNTINRINEVMEVDFGVRLLIVSDENLMYNDPLTDPFDDEQSLNSQIQSALTSSMGEDNYDIGHLFHRGAPNGNAGSIGNVCLNYQKGKAFSTHSFTATNGSDGDFLTDYFDMDYVAHEIGHQFGATHTYAYETESRQVNSEPGSGSTIMAYAGIVSGQNMQRHSDPYFHYHNIRQVNQYLANYACQTSSPTTNSAPTVNAGPDITIPKGTAYELAAVATDTDNDLLTYCWEQLDSGLMRAIDFGPDALSGSINRSLPPSASPSRMIPSLSEVLQGNLTERNPYLGSSWETVSTVGRTLRWGVTVRDRNVDTPSGVGFTAQDEKIITVDPQAGPFRILSLSSSTDQWFSGSNQRIEWDVAGTDQTPINSQTVTIYLSTDGGQTFPIRLLQNTPNDGHAWIKVPNGIASEQARIKIVPDNNIYFAINTADFTVATRTFSLPFDEVEKESCGTMTTSYTLQLSQNTDLSEAVNLSVQGLPNNLSAQISPSILSTNSQKAEIVLTRLGAISGTYSYTLEGSSSMGTVSQTFYTHFYSENPPQTNLISPDDAAENQAAFLELRWSANEEANQYRVELSTATDFSNIERQEVVSTNMLQLDQLDGGVMYYWRVFAINGCGESVSATRSFTTSTVNCYDYEVIGLPQNLQDATDDTIGVKEVSIAVVDALTIIDLDLTIEITHTYVRDLTLILINPQGEEIVLIQNQGGGGNNITNTIFDAEASLGIRSASPPFTGRFRPLEDFSSWYGNSARGIWRLRVEDNATIDSGQIRSVQLNLCLDGNRQSNSDLDLIPDEMDNCPLISNEDQVDSDQDGEGDLCDIDAQRNITLIKSDETCVSQDNGSLRITTVALFEYDLEITGPNGFSVTTEFSDGSIQYDDLQSGDYLVCLRSEQVSNFEQCYSVSIAQPEPLGVTANISVNKTSLQLNLEGSDRYYVSINSKSIEVAGVQNCILSLQKGMNVVEVATPLSCQGSYREVIYVDEPSLLYPNPVREQLTVLVGGDEQEVTASVIDLQGNVLSKTSQLLDVNSRQVTLNVSSLPTGNYIIRLSTTKGEETLKFIKL